MYSDRTGTDKNHPGQNLPDKRTPDRPPGQKPRKQLIHNLYKGLLPRFFVLGLLKIGGSDMCDVLYGRPLIWSFLHLFTAKLSSWLESDTWGWLWVSSAGYTWNPWFCNLHVLLLWAVWDMGWICQFSVMVTLVHSLIFMCLCCSNSLFIIYSILIGLPKFWVCSLHK